MQAKRAARRLLHTWEGWCVAARAVSISVLSICAVFGEAGPGEGKASGRKAGSSLVEELRWLEAEGLVIEIPTVVGASRFEQSSVKAPASVSVVTRDQIKKYGYRTLAEVMRSLRGFTFNYDRYLTLLGTRGFNHPSDLNMRALILVDGHRINENINEAAITGTDFPVDIDLIERVEVVRGPISALYGSNAFLALINITTRDPGDLSPVELGGSYGSFDAIKGRFSCAHVFENGPEFMLSATFADSQGPDGIDYSPDLAGPLPNNGIAEHDGDKDVHFFGKLSFMDFTFEGVYGKRDKDDPTGQFTNFNDPLVNNQDKHWYLDLSYEHSFLEDLDVVGRLFYDRFEYLWIGEYYDDGGLNEDVVNDSRFTGEWWGTEWVLTKPLPLRQKVTAGLEFRHNFRQDLYSYDLPSPSRPAGELYTDVFEDSKIWALFIQDQIEVLDNLILNAGLRYDHYSTFGGSLNPRAALIYNPLPKTIVKLMYGEAFRAPNAYELHFDDGVYLQASPGLDPEEIRTYELLLEQYIGKNYRVTLTGFRNELKNVIESVDSAVYPDGTINVNAGPAYPLRSRDPTI